MLPHTNNNHTSKDILLTGLNEFLAQSVLEELLLKFSTSRIFCLLDKTTVSPTYLKKLKNKRYKNVNLIYGNTSEERLGLCLEDYMFCVESVNCIVHCEDSFSSNKSLAFYKNSMIKASKNIMDLLQNIEELGQKKATFLYVSTVYHANKNNALIKEEILDIKNYNFKSPYEEAKYLCEQIILSYSEYVHTLIVRPSIILSKYNGEYEKEEENINNFINIKADNSEDILLKTLKKSSFYDFVNAEYVALNIVDILVHAKNIPHNTIFNITDSKGGLDVEHTISIINNMLNIHIANKEVVYQDLNASYVCENIQNYVYEHEMLSLNSSEILRRSLQYYLNKE